MIQLMCESFYKGFFYLMKIRLKNDFMSWSLFFVLFWRGKKGHNYSMIMSSGRTGRSFLAKKEPKSSGETLFLTVILPCVRNENKGSFLSNIE